MEDLQRKVTLDHFENQVQVVVRTERYAEGGGLAVRLIDTSDGGPYATISVNVEGVRLALDEFVFKTYSENAGLLEAMLDAGEVELTGRDTELGPVCRLRPDVMEKSSEEGRPETKDRPREIIGSSTAVYVGEKVFVVAVRDPNSGETRLIVDRIADGTEPDKAGVIAVADMAEAAALVERAGEFLK